MILPDFQNLYTNNSYLSREDQVRQFRKLIERINVEISDTADRYMQINLHGLLYSILSETSFNETVFMAADPVSTGLLAMYIEQLRPENILVASNLDETIDYQSDEFIRLFIDYLDMLKEEMPKPFTLMVFPYGILESDFEEWLKYIEDMLAYRGRIIIFDCPDMVPITDNYLLMADYTVSNGNTVKMLQTKKVFLPSEINLTVSLRIEKLQKDIIGIIDYNKINTHKLDQLIYESWELEKDIIRYHDEFHVGNIKYKINEIKNALLDLRYSEEIDIPFFCGALREVIQTIK